MPQSHIYSGRGLDRRLLLIVATLAAGSALASGFQMLSAWADEPPSNDKNSNQGALLDAQREPSATGYPRPFNY
jgi:hypothetical protein